MKTTKYPLARSRMIILYKFYLMTNSFFKLLIVKTFKEKTTFVTKHLGLKNKNFRYRSIDHIHIYILNPMTHIFEGMFHSL
ncbi:hypothetical protein WH06_11780 [Aeromonas salmonicida subsp. salmonicida]|nr:hypothetical protein NV17_20855 [Aeromonas salmonicida subsp. salmonicida]KTA92093.1 hypothetical protein VO71_15720 [Aeromonas salmonicida subsp. smithia]ORJ17988.1 hypothetical protein A7D03_21430 [Aeromonas salmonicida]KHE96313.1 hypothetical protein NX85_19375 [Aeromonas salmonicida subsp. salmonicida]KIX23581.1 hypothetical protein TM02_19140 [Aeromonas salmonicida subsp. salmonicida]